MSRETEERQAHSMLTMCMILFGWDAFSPLQSNFFLASWVSNPRVLSSVSQLVSSLYSDDRDVEGEIPLHHYLDPKAEGDLGRELASEAGRKLSGVSDSHVEGKCTVHVRYSCAKLSSSCSSHSRSGGLGYALLVVFSCIASPATQNHAL